MKNLTDVDAFTSPVTVPEDGVDFRNRGSSFEPGYQQLANRTKYLKERLEPTTPPTRTIYIPATAFEWGAASIAISNLTEVTVSTNSAEAYLSLSGILPDGAIVASVGMLVTPGAVRAGTNRTRIGIGSIAHDWTTPAVGGSLVFDDVYDDGATAALQVRTNSMTPMTVTHTAEEVFALLLQAGNTAGANPDVFYAVRITFTDPGPRNY